MNDPHRVGPHDVVTGALAGLAAGTVVLGAGGRVAMALIQLAHRHPPEWSWIGTAQVVAPGMALGPAAGVIYALVRRWLPGTPAARGLLFGAAHGAFWVTLYFLRPAGPIELSGSWRLGSALFAVLLLGFGLALAWLEDRWRPAVRSWALARPVVRALVITAAAGAALALWVLASR